MSEGLVLFPTGPALNVLLRKPVIVEINISSSGNYVLFE
jgi:hypothetical protein